MTILGGMDGGSCCNADHWGARVEGALPPKQTRLSGKGNSSRFSKEWLEKRELFFSLQHGGV